jgi:uncharacterized protein YdhG (YjbR/CyaY superfamily)
MATATAVNVEDYIASFPNNIQKILNQIRRIIKKAAPDAEEMISYNMPLYKWHGMLVSFAAWKDHIGLYPTPLAAGELKKKLLPYESAKATLKFPLDKQIPMKLITEIVKLRMKENLQRIEKKKFARKK